ncbi:hypothetical protein DENSPDRAFT_880505 [Dentipellis sp. KUC8613]|nr:hypothetical protein DENSPDRAFT_880505 [Dentipellis sp. KUC8613]
MLAKLSTLVVLVPFVSALTLNTPSNLHSGGPATISWTSSSGDPTVFSLELVNEAFHDTFAIANNVQLNSGSASLELPSVPIRDGYTIEAVDISNINSVFATSGSFAVAAPLSSSAAPSSTGSLSSVSAASSGASVTTPSAISPSSSGQTLPASGSSSSSSSSSASSPSSSLTNFNAAAALRAGFMNTGAVGAMVLGAVAGAVVIAL